MNTACNPCSSEPFSLVNTQRRTAGTWAANAHVWWTRWMTPRQNHLTPADLTALDGLTEETLKDIGAPEWMQARAQRAHERAGQGGLFERDSVHWR